ncbi:hypothetical protein [Algoriphagus sp. CAU 1675]|uniref:hypothetical protein n=1 Tax=Algoriphagus sp. CAU 1675 TaxID=3032597 RepID=UPI0023DB694A|nr:hypothetical protein [Algoriphagus sp. CAU 1675]MDF2156512.1 hypothetical protein [Algoriphagus sp. CAU 1675]
MSKTWLYIALILLILLNGMGYTLIQVHFYMDREQITALYCVNKDKPEMECNGKCELSKRLFEAKDQNESEAEITLEELNLTFLTKSREVGLLFIPEANHQIVHIPRYQMPHSLDLGKNFFHPPQG